MSFLEDSTNMRAWYAVQTYSGYENAVMKNLKQRIESLGMEQHIFDVMVPVEKKIKIKNNKRVEVEEKIYPGYVLVDMVPSHESWYVVRNTPRVTGFVGAGTEPVRVTEVEMQHIRERALKNIAASHTAIQTRVGEIVLIADGPFKDFQGKVTEIDHEKARMKILVDMFGRETSVELDFLQVRSL
jgi:transcription termination/antitermination protein NusG